MAIADPKSFHRRFKGKKWHVKRHVLKGKYNGRAKSGC
jgi:hypothetical protein